MECGAVFPSAMKCIELRLKVNLHDALALHEFLLVGRKSLESQINNILADYPQWKISKRQEELNAALDKYSLQHILVEQMETALRKKLEKEKVLKPEESSKQASPSGTEPTTETK